MLACSSGAPHVPILQCSAHLSSAALRYACVDVCVLPLLCCHTLLLQTLPVLDSSDTPFANIGPALGRKVGDSGMLTSDGSLLMLVCCRLLASVY
jgi:hypothetical protein